MISSVLKIEAYDTYVNSAPSIPKSEPNKRGVREQVPQTILSYEIGGGYSTVVGHVRSSKSQKIWISDQSHGECLNKANEIGDLWHLTKHLAIIYGRCRIRRRH